MMCDVYNVKKHALVEVWRWIISKYPT